MGVGEGGGRDCTRLRALTKGHIMTFEELKRIAASVGERGFLIVQRAE